MVRTFTFKMDSLEIKVASLSWKQTEEHVKAGRELLERTPAAGVEDWLDRSLKTVALSLAAASGATVEVEAIKENFDMPTINAMYVYILEVSGLKEPTGEVAAVTEMTSKPSVAA